MLDIDQNSKESAHGGGAVAVGGGAVLHWWGDINVGRQLGSGALKDDGGH